MIVFDRCRSPSRGLSIRERRLDSLVECGSDSEAEDEALNVVLAGHRHWVWERSRSLGRWRSTVHLVWTEVKVAPCILLLVLLVFTALVDRCSRGAE